MNEFVERVMNYGPVVLTAIQKYCESVASHEKKPDHWPDMLEAYL